MPTSIRKSSRLTTTAPANIATPAPSPPVTPVASPNPKPGSKQADLVALLKRPEGATINQMVAITGWLPHTTRAALTGLKKRGYAVTSNKIDGVRTYQAAGPKAA